MANRFRLSASLAALCVAALCGIVQGQYAPQWHVGDWWVVKTWRQSESGWVWYHVRYDVARIEKVGDRNCFVLEARLQSSKGNLSRTANAFYVRTDDWLVVRQVVTKMSGDRLLPPITLERPLGLFGPFQGGEPRLPRFPLQPGGQDTAFTLQQRDDGAAFLREISGFADSTLVHRLLDDGDTTGRRVVRPTGVVRQVRTESGGTLAPDPLPGGKRITQSFQLWCEDQPWRVYEELVNYDGQEPMRRVMERNWLTASGHSDK